MQSVTIRSPVDATDLPEVQRLVESEVSDVDEQDMFPQSVASGGPTPNGVILWTRIEPDRYDPSKSLRLEVAADEQFDDTVLLSELSGPGVKATDNYTIRVDLDDLLEPDSVYYYRFAYGGVQSPTGRCRTLPAEDATLESLRLGLLNCQNYQNGYFGAMAHLAETDVDFVLHLGDYIYEHVTEGPPKGETGLFADRRIDLPDGETLPMSLNDFRRIYETYKEDPHLRQLHESHTVIQTWDDHAIANDRFWDYDIDAPVFPEHPCGDVPQFTRYLTRAGIQAWWEFIPSRIKYDPGATHIHDSFELYQAVEFGDLVTLLLTDERLFRSRPISLSDKVRREFLSHTGRSKERNLENTMLGTSQREWFLETLTDCDTLWAVWANSVLFTPLTLGAGWLTPWDDSWDGYGEERTRILETLTEIQRDGQTSVVTLTGDMHTTLASSIRDEKEDTEPLGVEFMTPGVTSVNFAERVAGLVGGGTGSALAGRFASKVMRRILQSINTDYALLDSAHWGYSVLELSRSACTWDVYWVDKTVDSATAPSDPTYRIQVPVGSCDIQINDGKSP